MGILTGSSRLTRGHAQTDRGQLLKEIMEYNNLLSGINHDGCEGPIYTWWPDQDNCNTSQIDHFIVVRDIMHNFYDFCVHDENAMNLSDHYPISPVVKCDIPSVITPTKKVRYNWSKADLTTYKHNLRVNLESFDYPVTNIPQ